MNDDFDNYFKLTSDHVKRAIKIAGDAFQADPFTIFVYPDDSERKRYIQYAFKMIYAYGIKHGITYATSENLEGMIIWLPPDKIYPSIWTMMRYGGFYAMRKVGLKIKAIKRSIAVLKHEELKHKELVPFEHWYLEHIAVKPEEQGKGHGRRLLRPMINQIESEGLPIYLETNNEKNLPFYQKHGFEIIEHEIIPKTDVPLWCMLRKPR